MTKARSQQPALRTPVALEDGATGTESRGSVVLVTYVWPPDSAVGTVRPVKLAKYLTRQGWLPVVVTARDKYAERITPGWTGGETGAVVIRTRRIPNPRDFFVALKQTKAHFLGRIREYQQSKQSYVEGYREDNGETRERWSLRLKRYLLSLLYTPDLFLGWIPFGIPAAVRAVRQTRAQAVITTGPPFTAHLVGWATKRLTKVRWIADFRDPWLENKQLPTTRSDFSDHVTRWMRTRVVTTADVVVSVTPSMTQSFRDMYPELPSDKWVTITNGFDREDFAQCGLLARPTKFTIVYVGGFNYGRTPAALLRALSAMLRSGDLVRNDLSVRFVGDVRYADGSSLEEMIEQNGLGETVELVDFLPRQKALEEMVRADVLLLIVANQQNEVPAKTYEYMGAGSRILVLTDDSVATKDLVRASGVGVVVSPNDYDAIRKTLRQWYREYRESTVRDDRSRSDRLDDYEWKSLGARYASLLRDQRTNVSSSPENRSTLSLELKGSKS